MKFKSKFRQKSLDDFKMTLSLLHISLFSKKLFKIMKSLKELYRIGIGPS